MQFTFTKMEGLGNDYLYVYDDPDKYDAPALSIRLSERHFGAGSDGMIWIAPSDQADFKMRIFNADGSEAMMCGNGIRCVGKYVYDHGYTDKTHLHIDTLSGIKALDLLVEDGKAVGATVNMGKVEVSGPKTLDVDGEAVTCRPVSVGNPHAVLFLEELDSLIGLCRVKEIVHKAIKKYRYNKLCLDKGLKRSNPTMHMVFTGNPGTAKTTIARLIGQILAEEGILPTGEFIEVGKSELVGPAVGSTPIIVKEQFRKAKGGVLFIDEAYSLCGDSFSDDAITTIVQEMENNREDTVVIFAGYPAPMKDFLDHNPGMRSRIAFNIDFDDYSAEELMEITGLMLSREQMTASPAALEKLRRIYENAAGSKDFGNGRFVRELLEHAEMNLSERVMELQSEELTPEVLGRIEECDITDLSVRAKVFERRIGFAKNSA